MSPEYTTLTTQEVGSKAAALNISGKPESLMELIVWAQQRALAQFVSADGPAVEIRVLGEVE